MKKNKYIYKIKNNILKINRIYFFINYKFNYFNFNSL